MPCPQLLLQRCHQRCPAVPGLRKLGSSSNLPSRRAVPSGARLEEVGKFIQSAKPPSRVEVQGKPQYPRSKPLARISILGESWSVVFSPAGAPALQKAEIHCRAGAPPAWRCEGSGGFRVRLLNFAGGSHGKTAPQASTKNWSTVRTRDPLGIVQWGTWHPSFMFFMKNILIKMISKLGRHQLVS